MENDQLIQIKLDELESCESLQMSAIVTDYLPTKQCPMTHELVSEEYVEYIILSCVMEREDGTTIEFDNNEEDDLMSLLSLGDQQQIKEGVIEELLYAQ